MSIAVVMLLVGWLLVFSGLGIGANGKGWSLSHALRGEKVAN